MQKYVMSVAVAANAALFSDLFCIFLHESREKKIVAFFSRLIYVRLCICVHAQFVQF